MSELHVKAFEVRGMSITTATIVIQWNEIVIQGKTCGVTHSTGRKKTICCSYWIEGQVGVENILLKVSTVVYLVIIMI